MRASQKNHSLAGSNHFGGERFSMYKHSSCSIVSSSSVIVLVSALVACTPKSFDREQLPQKIVVNAQKPQMVNPVPQSKSMCDQPRKSVQRNPALIINGTREPSLVPMSDAQKMAVISIGDAQGNSFCSGTLIAGRYVLTARHCTVDSSPAEMWVRISADNQTYVWQSAVAQLWENDSADFSILQLENDAVVATGVEPITPNTQDMDSSWIGQRVEASGFGAIDLQGRQDGRFFVAEPISDVDRSMITINGEGYHGVCFGDSGGPVLATIDGVLHVLGALSNGDASCTGHDHYTRIDKQINWLRQIPGDLEAPPVNACGDLSTAGYCADDNSWAMYCDNDQVRQQNCAAAQHCGWDDQAEGYRCVDADPCQGIDALGTCDGDQAVWCADGELKRFDCGACGWSCDWASDATGFDCVQQIGEPAAPSQEDENVENSSQQDDDAAVAEVPVTSSDPCDHLDYLGQCDGDLAQWCNGGEYHSVDCAAQGYVCAYIDDASGYYCAQPVPADPCENLDYNGRCDGALAEWCSDGEYHSVNCADYGYACGYVGAFAGYYCVR